MHGESPYEIMFGPDICGPGTKKVIFHLLNLFFFHTFALYLFLSFADHSKISFFFSFFLSSLHIRK
jgi:hypothetical protein